MTTYYVVVVHGKVPKERVVHKDPHCHAGGGGPPNRAPYSLDEIQEWALHHAEVGPNAKHGVLVLDDASRAKLPNRDCKVCG